MCPLGALPLPGASLEALTTMLTERIEYKLISLTVWWTETDEKSVKMFYEFEEGLKWFSYNFKIVSVLFADSIPSQPTKQISQRAKAQENRRRHPKVVAEHQRVVEMIPCERRSKENL